MKEPLADRVYRYLLRLLPFDFQREFGAEMEDVFREERRHVGTGAGRRSVLWCRTVAGLLSAAISEHVDVLRRDVKYGVRSLRKSPMFTAVAVTALGIGMGAGLTVFGFANALLLRPLPVPNAGEVVQVFQNRWGNVGYGDYIRYRDQNATVTGLSISTTTTVAVEADGPAEALLAMAVSGNYFRMLGLAPTIGRGIGEEDDRPGAAGVAMLGHRFWQRRYGADPSVLGRTISIDGSAFRIIGVTPDFFDGTMAPLVPDLWIPWNSPHRSPVDSGELTGRLRQGVSPAQARANFGTIAAAIGRDLGEPAWSVTVSSGRMLHPEVSVPVMAFAGGLMALAILALLVACLNIANLSLARAALRRGETGVRVALGAGRGRLLRQALTESLILSSAGMAAAAIVALVAFKMVGAVPLPAEIPATLEFDVAFDWRMVLFAIAVTVGAAVLFGLPPALQSVKANVSPMLKESSTAGPRRSRLRAACIVSQLAASTVLLVVASLFVRSVGNAEVADRGLDPRNVLTATLSLQNAGYDREDGLTLLETLRERLESAPGVVSANVTEIVPLTLSNSGWPYQPEGGEPVMVNHNVVSRGHLKTLGISLLAGRDFTVSDRPESAPVAIVNERLARRFWPNESPLGKRLRSGDGPWIEVVGMARDSKYVSIMEEPRLFLYRPMGQRYSPRRPASLLVKTRGNPLSVLPAVRETLRELDPGVALFGVNSLEEAAKISLLPVRVVAAFAGLLGAVALLLAVIGIYGVVSYLARSRSRETGIRVALGARRAQVIRHVTSDAVRWTFWGLLLGLAAALAAAQLLRDWIFGIGPADPVSFGGIALILSLTAIAAAWIPARRAARINPAVVLRGE